MPLRCFQVPLKLAGLFSSADAVVSGAAGAEECFQVLLGSFEVLLESSGT